MANIRTEQVPAAERPLVTFALFAYNQEKYIREAVEGALAQTYEPLEIILSDDCSTDRTFQIIKEISIKYQGPHKVVINKNSENMGISSHVRKIHEMSNGNFIIHAAGDDISVPERALSLVNVFKKLAKSPSMVVSNAIKIDEFSKELGLLSVGFDDVIYNNNHRPLSANLPINGCTVAISRKLVEEFPDPINRLIAEDVLLQRRAYLLDGIAYIPDILVKYRVHEDAITAKKINKTDQIRHLQIWQKDRLLRLDQFIVDANHINYQLSEEDRMTISHDKKSIELSCEILNFGITFGVWALLKSFYFEFIRGGNINYFKDRVRLFACKWF